MINSHPRHAGTVGETKLRACVRLGTQIRCHHDNGIAEVSDAARSISQTRLPQHLKEDVINFW